MCFGMTTTGSQTTIPSNFTQGAAQNTFNFAQGLASQPFNAPLQNIAGFNPMQTQGWSTISQMASAPNANNPFYSTIANDYANFGSTALPTIQPASVLGSGVSPAATTLQSYIDPNLALELNPTLAEITRQADIAKSGPGGVGSAATAAGAFGDARQGVENANVDEAALRQAAQATGQAYQNAFTNAANLRGMDVSNLMSAQQQNAQLAQQRLQNILGSGNALTNLAQYQTGTGLNLAQAGIAGGTQQQQNAQQQLNAIYNQQLQNLLGPYQYQIPALNSTLSALTPTQPSTTTVQQPNNALWHLLGTVLGSAAQGYGQGYGKQAAMG
jgi:hypothetical protein